MGNRISSPGDSYYQGRGKPDYTDTDLGKTKTTPSQDKIIDSLMLRRAKLDRMKKRGPKQA
tara:strand:+ start:105 stop:287 length:183 start_codon:yes stop_codon:yes gene_type:complete